MRIDSSSTRSAHDLRPVCRSPWSHQAAAPAEPADSYASHPVVLGELTPAQLDEPAASALGVAARLGLGVLGLAALASPTGVLAATTAGPEVAASSISLMATRPQSSVDGNGVELSATSWKVDPGASKDSARASGTSKADPAPSAASTGLGMRVSGFPTAAPTASLVGAVAEGPSSGTGLQASRYAAIQDAAAGEGADASFADSLYESAKERARQVGETVHGIKQGVKDAGVRVTNTLNDNPVSRYHAEGNVGDYTWVFTPARFNVDPYVTLQLNKAGVGSHNELSVAKVSLMKEDQHGEFKHSQGVRAEIVAHYDLGVGSNLSPGGFTNDATNGRFFGSRIEGYSRWSNNATHGWNITVDANAGYVASFTGSGSTVYARSLERFDNKDLGERLIGHDSKILAELETGVTRSLSDGGSNAYYRVFGGAEFPVSMKVRGKDHALMLDAGVSVSGNSHESAKLRPELRARLQF